ncbi:MAG: zf-HC2 domain-containing protein [Gemmatimonadales bacterium]
MDCAQFLNRYTDFRDGLISASRERRNFERHLACCARCRDYDAAVRLGVRALQSVETIHPSPDFRRRLERRLDRERAATGPVLAGRAGVAAALLFAVALSLVALEGVVRRPQMARAPALPPVPFPQPVAQAGVPFVTFQDPRAGVAPSPYGALQIEPVSAGR